MTQEQVFTRAIVVTPGAAFEGTVVVSGGLIRDVQPGNSQCAGAVDLEGDYLLPGLVELHTDNLEHHIMPRPSVEWPSAAALLAHDAQMSALGITTVLDAISLGIGAENPARRADVLDRAISTITELSDAQALRAEHWLHLRLELTGDETLELFERHAANPKLRLISIMDHTPGQRQWRDLDRWRTFHSTSGVWTDDEIRLRVEKVREAQARNASRNLEGILHRVRSLNLPVASHDDTTAEHVAEAIELGISISEFPTTLGAARKAKEAGMSVVGGAPNLVRGGSHSGNVAVADLARERTLDALSSDYVPVSLLHGAFALHDTLGMPLPDAIATVTRNPARMVGLDDRGSIQPGKRADLVRVRRLEEAYAVVAVWRRGARIA